MWPERGLLFSGDIEKFVNAKIVDRRYTQQSNLITQVQIN